MSDSARTPLQREHFVSSPKCKVAKRANLELTFLGLIDMPCWKDRLPAPSRPWATGGPAEATWATGAPLLPARARAWEELGWTWPTSREEWLFVSWRRARREQQPLGAVSAFSPWLNKLMGAISLARSGPREEHERNNKTAAHKRRKEEPGGRRESVALQRFGSFSALGIKREHDTGIFVTRSWSWIPST